MQPYFNSVAKKSGPALAGVSVTVTVAATGDLATIYSDNGITPQPNPMTTDSKGAYLFYAADGSYVITISGDKLVPYSFPVQMEDPLDNPAVTVTQLGQPTGAAMTGYLADIDAVARSMQDKMRESVSVMDFMTPAEVADVVAGTLSIDVVPKFLLALSKGKPVRVPTGPGWKYRFGSALLVPSNATLHSDFAQIVLADGSNSHVIRIADNAQNVTISGLSIDGRKSTNTGGHGIATNGGSNIRILGCAIKNVGAAGIYFAGAAMSGVAAHDNFITGSVAGGITANNTVTNFSFNDNHCWLNGTHGVGVLGIAKNGTINDNVCWDNGQGDPNADNITGYNVGNENITVSGNACKGGLNNGIHMGGQRLIITGNVVDDPAQYGIVMRPDTGVGDDCIVANNVANSAGVSGFWIEACNSGAVTGNVSRDNAAHGFAIDACANVTFTGNTARGNTGDGFRNGTASAWLTFTGNTARNNGGDGIELANVTDSTLTGNTFRANTGFGINVSGTEARNVIVGNTARGNTGGQIAQPATTTRVSQNETGVSRSLASAAALTLPPGGEYFYVTGTTGITSINASFPERRVTLQFDDALTVTDGSNLRLAGNFVTTFMDTITLISDGTNWIECSRSVN